MQMGKILSAFGALILLIALALISSPGTPRESHGRGPVLAFSEGAHATRLVADGTDPEPSPFPKPRQPRVAA